MKVTVIGVGNIGGAIARGLSKGTILKASDITCTDLIQENLNKMLLANKDFVISNNNLEAVKGANMVIIAVKPWRVESVINEIKYTLKYDKQIIVSIAAGIPFDRLNEFLDKESDMEYGSTPTVFRVIPNTAIEVRSSMTFVSSSNATDEQEELVVNLFNELGSAMLIEEQLMTAGTALASSGIAFAMRYIRASSEGGVELGFYPNQAKEIVLKTVKGAVDLLLANQSNPETEIDKVTTPGGITIKGLNEMELSGFTSSVIRGLKASK